MVKVDWDWNGNRKFMKGFYQNKLPEEIQKYMRWNPTTTALSIDGYRINVKEHQFDPHGRTQYLVAEIKDEGTITIKASWSKEDDKNV